MIPSESYIIKLYKLIIFNNRLLQVGVLFSHFLYTKDAVTSYWREPWRLDLNIKFEDQSPNKTMPKWSTYLEKREIALKGENISRGENLFLTDSGAMTP